jgi:hypothetical protein
LCAQIGCPHPNYLGTERWPLTSDEFTDWIARSELKPFANEWLQTAIVASEVHNAGVMLARTWGLPADSPYTVTDTTDYMPIPQDKKKRKKRKSGGRKLSAREAELQMRARYGM